MRKRFDLFGCILLLSVFLFSVPASAKKDVKGGKSEYVVLVSKAVQDDAAWNKVVEALQTLHDALVIPFDKLPGEVLEPLKKAHPRYVAVVEKPENITPEYIRKMHRVSREAGSGIFEAFLWGMITGYDAESALRVVEDARTPMVIRTALSTAQEMEYTSCFDKCGVISQDVQRDMFKGIREAFKNADPVLVEQLKQLNEVIKEKSETNQPVSDSLTNLVKEINAKIQANSAKTKIKTMTAWEEKTREQDTLTRHEIEVDSILFKFLDLYKQLDPEFLLTSSYGVDYTTLHRGVDEVVRAKEGKLFLDFKQGPEYFPRGENRRVYLATGYYGGATFGKADNQVTAWMKDGNVSALAGYCKRQWHEQAGWGTWKLWIFNPGRYTFAEAVFMNMQFILSRLNDWNPKFQDVDYPETDDVNRDWESNVAEVTKAIGADMVTLDQMGYLYDRDAFVYYGDPKWDARLQASPEDLHYKVTTERKGNKYVLTIQTDSRFDRRQMSGNYYKEKTTMFNSTTLGRLPFSYFFPERLNNPKLAKKLAFEGGVEVNENFIFIHDCFFEPNQTYEVVLSVKK